MDQVEVVVNNNGKIRKIFSRLDTLQNSRFFFFSKPVKKSVKRGVRVFRAKIRTVLQSTVLTVQALSIKDLQHGQKENFFVGTTREIPSPSG